MAYFLMIEKENGKHIPLEISKSKHFIKLTSLKDKEYNLQEIDLFTMSFINEELLKESLLEDNILSNILKDNKISIVKILKNRYYKVAHGLLYQEDFKYIDNPNKIIEDINELFLEKNFYFIIKLASYLKDNNIHKDLAFEIWNKAIICKKRDKIINYFYELDENNDNSLTRILKMTIFDYYINKEGLIEYKNTIKYQNLHMLIAFINHYEKKQNNQKENNYSKIRKNDFSLKSFFLIFLSFPLYLLKVFHSYYL